MKNQFKIFTYLLVIMSLITSCDKSETIIPLPATEEPVNNYPAWLSVENGDLGQVIFTQLTSNGDDKETYQIQVSGNTDQINWEFYQNGDLITHADNLDEFSPTISSADETFTVALVDGPLVYNLGETNITYRYNLDWESGLSEEDVLRTYNSAIAYASNSPVLEVATILETVFIKIINEEKRHWTGQADGNGIIMNIFPSAGLVHSFTGVWIHEASHIYESNHPEVEQQMWEFYNNAEWTYPTNYYASGRDEMLACSLAAYILDGTGENGGQNRVLVEPYYHNVLLPYFQGLFETN